MTRGGSCHFWVRLRPQLSNRLSIMRLSLPPLGRAWQREATLASLMMGHNERRFYKNNPHGVVVSYFQPLFLAMPWDKGKEMEREGPQDSTHLFPGLSCQPRASKPV